jgi:hypothetical protein
MAEIVVSAVAFVPEIGLEKKIGKEKSLGSGVFVLPPSHKHAVHLKKSIEDIGHSIKNGFFLYFNGHLREDGTIYEIFQSYCLALTFYYEGRATCRAYQEVDGSGYGNLEIFIDEHDKFEYDPEDARILKAKDEKIIAICYKRISEQLASRDFNPLNNSIDFFNLFLKENSIKTRLLYLNICLESLFLGDSDSEGISYKLGARCACLMASNDKSINKKEAYFEVKSGYDLRSKIIHGGDYKKASTKIITKDKSKAKSELDHVLILEKIVKRVYRIVFCDDNYYESVIKNELGKKIDSDLIFAP